MQTLNFTSKEVLPALLKFFQTKGKEVRSIALSQYRPFSGDWKEVEKDGEEYKEKSKTIQTS